MIDWSEEAKKVLAIDWNKSVQTDSGSKVVKLDDNFNSRHGMATLFKVLKAPDLVSDGSDWLGYQVHATHGCYSTYADQELGFGIKNTPTKHRGWIAIYNRKSTYGAQRCSDVYPTKKAIPDLGVRDVLCYREVEWEEP